VISGIPVTGINFSRAWTRLVSRYENKRVLIQSYFEMLSSLKPMTKRSAKALEKLRATVTEVEESLTTLCSNEERWEFLLVYFISQRLDGETQEAWEMELGNSTAHPRYS